MAAIHMWQAPGALLAVLAGENFGQAVVCLSPEPLRRESLRHSLFAVDNPALRVVRGSAAVCARFGFTTYDSLAAATV